jgi:hypothetical protein
MLTAMLVAVFGLLGPVAVGPGNASAHPADFAAAPSRPPEEGPVKPRAKSPSTAPALTKPKAAPSKAIEIHVGIPGRAYLGQPMKALLAEFPKAKVSAFAEQSDAFVVQVPEAGISSYVVGESPDGLMVASIGFNFDTTYLGVNEGEFRSGKGIGRGSTVNDLLEAYGQPTRITGERPQGSPPGRPPQSDDPKLTKKYLYASPDGSVTTYFIVQDYLVRRMVVNLVTPLDRHIFKHRPEGQPPTEPPLQDGPGPNHAPPGQPQPPRP